MFTSAVYLIIAASLAVASAAPSFAQGDSNHTSSLALSPRSSDERVFLANCYYGYPGSEMLYYSHDAESFTGQQPDDIAFIGNGPNQTPFEGQTVSGTFESGNTFTSEIAPGAQNLANFQFAGTGRNNYHEFNCYKDDDRELFSAIWGEYTQVCYSKYYCQDVSSVSWPLHECH
jgi:hypothetical protein